MVERNQPGLKGRRVVVTRPYEPEDRLVEFLEEADAEVVRFPVIEIVPASDQALATAVQKIKQFDVIGLTSPNGARHFLDAIGEQENPGSLLTGKLVCAVGPSTAEVLQSRGVHVDLVSEKGLAASLAEDIANVVDLDALHVLLPLGDLAGTELETALSERGAIVERVVAYINHVVNEPAGEFADQLLDGKIDVVTFASGSAVRGFVERLGWETFQEARGTFLAASIGPSTSEVVRASGATVDIEADVHTARGLVDSIRAYYAADGQ